MNGPSLAWLADVAAATRPPETDNPTIEVPPEVIAPTGKVADLSWRPTDPIAQPAGAMTNYDPLKDRASNPLGAVPDPAATWGPAPTATSAWVPNQSSSPKDPNAFPLLAGGGGGTIPAHEVERRGPSLLAAQANRNQAVDNTIDKVADRNEEAANVEYEMALDQERAARAREAAMQQSVAEREEEFAQRQADYDDTVSQLGRMGTIDQGRFWASRTTGQKVAGYVELMLAGMRGTPSMLMKRIDDDVKAQEFAYHATRDTSAAKQTAFSMAMAKYQNADAARAAARAAAIDVTQSQLAQVSAKWKGTEAANRADMARDDLQNEKMRQIQAGIQFIPPQATGRRWVDPRTGLVYSEQEAKALMAKREENAHADRTQARGIGGQILVDQAKREAEGGDALGKEGRQKLALEEATSRIERDSILNAIGNAQKNVDAIVKGGPIGAAYAHAPAWAPGATNARAESGEREAYNRRVMLAVAAAYKLSTDATEPKRKELLEHYAEPYILGTTENHNSALKKMELLRRLVDEGASSKGVPTTTSDTKSVDMPGSTKYGAK